MVSLAAEIKRLVPPFRQGVRRLNGLTIYFRDKNTVYVSDGKTAIYCERWFERPLGSYAAKWNPFCDRLKQTNSLSSIRDICLLALRYEVSVVTARYREEIPENVKVYETKFIPKRRKKNEK